MLIDKDQIRAIIPHAGSMCVLDEVLEWNENSVLCQTRSHLLSDNPLRCKAGLSAIQGIEYGMQSMAVHGGLLARQKNETAPPGFAAALRDIRLNTEWLHDIDAALLVSAKALVIDAGSYIYQFEIKDNERILVQGRATIMSQLGSKTWREPW